MSLPIIPSLQWHVLFTDYIIEILLKAIYSFDQIYFDTCIWRHIEPYHSNPDETSLFFTQYKLPDKFSTVDVCHTAE